MIAPCAEFWKGSTLIAAVTSLFALSAVASQLPAPGNLHVSDFTTTSLSLSADEVPGAVGYAFKVMRLEGVPKTEIREDFALAPSLSASRWVLSSSNAKLDYYSSQSYYDIHTSDKRALRIDRESSVGDVTVEIETPVCEAAIRSCSFVCRVGSRKSDVFRVMGRTDSSSAWAELHGFWPDNAKTNITVSVDAAANVRQVKFVFAASATNFSAAAWDSLSVVYGGDEPRTVIEPGTTVLAAPQFSTNALPTAQYAFQVRALGGEGVDDSPWSDEQIVDLAWADLTVDPPTDVVVADVGGRLRISWNAVENAASYLVTIFPSGNPYTPVVENLSTTVTSCDVEVPSLGEYSAVVTAVSPGGKSSASSVVASGQVTQGHFRLTGAAPLRGNAFEEMFSSLTNMTGDTAVKNAYLDYWQFMRDSEELEKLLFTSTTNRPNGGVYAFCDTNETVDSYALGSLATGDHGYAFGIALVNDGNAEVDGDMTLSFDSIQRSFRQNSATYVFEWKVTTGETDIGSEGGWTKVEIPQTVPYGAESADCPSTEYRQLVSVSIALGRRLEPGDVLVLRWRHPKGASGPMMAIDNVRLDFTRRQRAFRMILR